MEFKKAIEAARSRMGQHENLGLAIRSPDIASTDTTRFLQ
jgi:hypothetical protein